MSRLYMENTLSKEDQHFLRTYRSISQLTQEMSAVSCHTQEKWVGNPNARTNSTKFVCQVKDFYSPPDRSNEHSTSSKLNPYPTPSEMDDMMSHENLYIPHEEYDYDIRPSDQDYNDSEDFYDDEDDDDDTMFVTSKSIPQALKELKKDLKKANGKKKNKKK